MTPRDATARPNSIVRRTVLRTAAWSVPAVSVASAAPAFATSGSAMPAGLMMRAVNYWSPSPEIAAIGTEPVGVPTDAFVLGVMIQYVQSAGGMAPKGWCAVPILG